MTDRELLELAAEAAGIHIHHWFDKCNIFMCSSVEGGDPDYGWNPLEEDGDAFRLLVEIGNRHNVTLEIGCGGADCDVARREVYGFQGRDETHALNSATRRAIVKAAAEIGKENQ